MSRPARLFPGLCRGGFVIRHIALVEGQSGGNKEGRKYVGCFAVPPPEDTVSSGAIRDESPSSTRVVRLSFQSVRIVCVCVYCRTTPGDGASFSHRIISLSLIPFHSPMRRFDLASVLLNVLSRYIHVHR